MQQTFFEREWRDVTVGFGMSEGFVDVIKLDAFGGVIAVDRFQTGNFIEKWGSCQAAKYEDRIVTLELAKTNGIPLRIVSFEIGKLFPDFRRV